MPKNSLKTTDYWLFVLTLLLTAFGVIMVYDASVAEAYRDFSDKFHFAKLQLQWAGAGLLALLIASRLPLVLIQRLAFPLFIFSLCLLAVVLLPGLGHKVQGAQRWLDFGPFKLQPSELVKLSFVIYLSTWLTKRRPLPHFLLLAGLILGLVMLQPDLGTALVISLTALTLYFLSGAPVLHLFGTLFAGTIAGLILIFTSAYRRSRFLSFLNPGQDLLGASYHLRQILIALGSGGLLGAGIGRSRQKYQYLPEAATDSIFAVIAEEIGFLGSVVIIGLFFLIIYRGFRLSRRADKPFPRLLAAGITSWLGWQTIINLASMVALVPLTGVPLPFISYGGSSLITIMTGIGILLNISRHL